MRSAAVIALLECAALCGCQTTGDPTQGGLFGWSEAKAQQREADKETALSREQSALQTEQARGAGLDREMRENSSDLAEQQAELSQLLANAGALEKEAPTPAAASRAHRLRGEIEAAREDGTLTVQQRWSLLHRYAREVDLMRAEVAGQ